MYCLYCTVLYYTDLLCPVYCPFPGFIEHGKILLIGNMGLYEYRPYVRKIQNGRQIMFQVGGDTGHVYPYTKPVNEISRHVHNIQTS